MYSLNASPPSAVTRLATELARDLPQARSRARGTHTLVVKRLGDGDQTEFAHVSAQVREALAGAPTCAARISGIDLFDADEVPIGSAPVVYLAVESPGLDALHERLCEVVDPVDNVIEGDGYTAHVTIARGGSKEAARALTEREVEPIEWTVDELEFWDAERKQPAGRISLPA